MDFPRTGLRLAAACFFIDSSEGVRRIERRQAKLLSDRLAMPGQARRRKSTAFQLTGVMKRGCKFSWRNGASGDIHGRCSIHDLAGRDDFHRLQFAPDRAPLDRLRSGRVPVLHRRQYGASVPRLARRAADRGRSAMGADPYRGRRRRPRRDALAPCASSYRRRAAPAQATPGADVARERGACWTLSRHHWRSRRRPHRLFLAAGARQTARVHVTPGPHRAVRPAPARGALASLCRARRGDDAHDPAGGLTAQMKEPRRTERRGLCFRAEGKRYFRIKLPSRRSISAWRISPCVFMTIGPCQAIGSRSGRPETSRKRTPSSPAFTLISSPAPNTTSERLPTLSRISTSSPLISASRKTPNGSDASEKSADPSNT